MCVWSGQVAHRMNYWLRFKEVTGISLGLWCLSYILYSALPRNTNPGGISNLMYALFFLILLCQLRGVVRARYAIPVSDPPYPTHHASLMAAIAQSTTAIREVVWSWIN